ncbi:MAG: hypothetical protein ACKVZH_07305 [Blastocatellia bacterium]
MAAVEQMNPDWVDSSPKYGSVITGSGRTDVYKLVGDSTILQWSLHRARCFTRETSVQDALGKEQYRIERQRRMPYSKCALRSDQEHIWTLTTLSIVRHRHELQFADGSVWKFKTPFFSIGLNALESNDVRVVGKMDSEFRWLFAIHPAVDSAPAAIAVALLHEHRFGA